MNADVDNIDASAVDLVLSKESNVVKDLTVNSDLDSRDTQRSSIALDIGQYSTPEIPSISSDLRYKLLKDPWKPNANYNFPSVSEGKRKRFFNIHWFKEFSWLSYSNLKEGAFCRFCVIFANRHPSCGTVGVFVV